MHSPTDSLDTGISLEQQKLIEKEQEVLDRLQLLIHETFTQNPFGKELLDYWTKQYIYPIVGPSNDHIEYITAAADFVRQIHALTEGHRFTLNKEK